MLGRIRRFLISQRRGDGLERWGSNKYKKVELHELGILGPIDAFAARLTCVLGRRSEYEKFQEISGTSSHLCLQRVVCVKGRCSRLLAGKCR